VVRRTNSTNEKKTAPKVRNQKNFKNFLAYDALSSKNKAKPKKKTYEHSNIVSKTLYLIGFPVYYLLSRILIAIAFILYITGHATKEFFTLISRIFVLLFKKRKTKIKIAAEFLFYKKWPPKKISPKNKLRKKRKVFFLITFLKKLLSYPKSISRQIMSSTTSLGARFRMPRIRTIHTILGFFVSIFILTPILFSAYILHGLPSPKLLSDRNIDVSTKIYDRNGVILYTIYKDKNRTIIPLSKIPLEVRLSTLAAEDAEFYSHPGFSIRGILRSLVKNASRGEVSGGSTITQQLVKNALLTPEKTITRKLKEVVLSLLVETKYTKDQILEMYLNEVGYGGAAYGIEEASQTYFGKSVNKLSLAEAALLAGLPKSPTTYSPYGAHPELAMARQKEVLNLMRINGFITDIQEKEAEKERLTFVPNTIDIKAPHFVMYTKQLLDKAYGKSLVEKGGLEVITTLDYNIQVLTENVLKSELEKLKGLNVTNAAAVVLNPNNGQILAMVGSKDYFDTSHDGNVNVATSPRQPGSSIKIVNYAYALSHGYTPATIVSDTPTSFSIKGQAPYAPKNYDGAYKGNLSLRSAFAQSRNIPAVKILASYGVDNMIDLGQKMGITTWGERNRFGLSLTLGGGEVTLLELAQVYATVSNSGIKPQISGILNVKGYKGDELFALNKDCSLSKSGKIDANAAMLKESGSCTQEQVLDPRVAFLITNILSDNVARAPAFGNFSSLVIPNHPEVAVKTGTSNNLRDNLTVGYNQDYLVAVWVGNNDNSPMARVASGVTGASPIWNKIMSALIGDAPPKNWNVPPGLSQIAICPQTASLPCQGCGSKMEWFLDETKPKFACNSQVVQKITQNIPQGEILREAASTENFSVQTRSIN